MMLMMAVGGGVSSAFLLKYQFNVGVIWKELDKSGENYRNETLILEIPQ